MKKPESDNQIKKAKQLVKSMWDTHYNKGSYEFESSKLAAIFCCKEIIRQTYWVNGSYTVLDSEVKFYKKVIKKIKGLTMLDVVKVRKNYII